MRENIYSKYGGFDFWHDCIYELYLKLLDHPELSYHFINLDIEKLSSLQTQYLVRYIGGPHRYDGRPIQRVYENLDITSFQFEEIVKAFSEVFRSKGVEERDIKSIIRFIKGHKRAIVTAKWNIMDIIMRPIYALYDWYQIKVVLNRK